MNLPKSFDLSGKSAVVLGGTGVLGAAIAEGLAQSGARVAVAGRNAERSQAVAERLNGRAGPGLACTADATDIDSLSRCAEEATAVLGQIDILVNAVGGNSPDATTTPEQGFFDLSAQGMEDVVRLNLMGGAILPAQVFGRRLAANKNGGSILHISSMAAHTPLTRVPGYCASKAALENFTRWLAVYLAQEHGSNLRVNALAPGFFLTEQNRFLLTDENTGKATPRGESILASTPMGRFGDPEEVAGAAVWLSSDAARFVTGAVIPVDGGFSAFSGV